MSGADLKAIATEAGMFAVRKDKELVEMTDFLEAVSKVSMAADTQKMMPVGNLPQQCSCKSPTNRRSPWGASF